MCSLGIHHYSGRSSGNMIYLASVCRESCLLSIVVETWGYCSTALLVPHFQMIRTTKNHQYWSHRSINHNGGIAQLGEQQTEASRDIDYVSVLKVACSSHAPGIFILLSFLRYLTQRVVLQHQRHGKKSSRFFVLILYPGCYWNALVVICSRHASVHVNRNY